VLGIVFSYNEKLANDANFNDKITALKQTLALWKCRDLTGIGKVLITKVFGLSKILYVSSMIFTPIVFQRKINAIVHQYIWNGPDKVKRSVLKANYDDGGLKMVDIFARIKAQQMMWLKRFFIGNEVGWKLIFSHYLSKLGGLRSLLQSNYDMKKINCHIPEFYKTILNTWSELTYKEPDTIEKICNQIIWNNKQILVDGKSVYYESFTEAGVIKICDLFYEDGKIKPFDTLGIVHQKSVNYLKWYGIVQTIPKHWRKKMSMKQVHVKVNKSHHDDIIGCIVEDKFVPLDALKSNQIYQHLLKLSITAPKCLYTLRDVYGLNLQNCKDLFILPWKVTIDSRLRWLQFRINHRILPTNKWLHKIGLIESPYCTRCNLIIETIDHLFIYCPEVDNFWQQFLHKWSELFDTISILEKCFGLLNDDIENWQVKNQLLMIARRYIYMCKYSGSSLSISVFGTLVKDTARIERVLAEQKGRLDFHYQKWSKIGVF